MKSKLLFMMGLVLLALVSCKEAAKTEPAAPATAPDYAAFDKKVEVIRAFYKAQCAEDLPALAAFLADTLQYSPPNYNGNKWLGKTELLATLKAYHENYENIQYQEGLVLPDSTATAYWAGSVFPQSTATNKPTTIRAYGTWTATESKSKQNVGIKFYSLTSVDDAGKIVRYSDYFDINSLLPKNTQ